MSVSRSTPVSRARCTSARGPRQRRRRIGLLLGAVTTGIALATVVSPAPATHAQETRPDPMPEQAASNEAPDETVQALERALEGRMTVWRTSARTIYVRHCRDAREGCEERLGTFARMIGDAAERHTLDPFLLAAVAVRESALDPEAAGAAGERGIVQLHPRGSGARVRYVRSESYRRSCARRPGACQEEVLDVGARLLARNIERCGGVREALGAYNRGECGETDYARGVMSERQRLLRLVKQPEALAAAR
jgi:hypothetical protein